MLLLMPYGFVFALIAMFIGFMIVFSLDAWEARMLVFINWALNFGLNFLLLMSLK